MLYVVFDDGVSVFLRFGLDYFLHYETTWFFHYACIVSFFTLWALTFTLSVSVKKSEIGVSFKKWLPKTNNEDNKIEELKKAKELLDAGVITQEEFDAKKKQILGL